MDEIVLRRSMLFLPGNNERFLTRALETAADTVILDLEDAVSPDHKVEARETVRRFLRTVDFRGKERAVRVNGVTTEWSEADVQAAVEGGADLIVLPKADSDAVVQTADRLVTEAERGCGAVEGRTRLMLLIETPLGVINVEQTALASPRTVALAFGAGDYGLATRVRPTPDEAVYLYPETKVMLAARVAGVMAIGTPYVVDVRDLAGMARQTRRQRDLGYDGKTVIHPTHVPIANEAFTTSPEEIAYAKKVVAAFEAAGGRGAITVDGRLIEHLHATEARRMLALARKAGVLKD